MTWKWEGLDGLRQLGRRITQFNIGWLRYLTIVGIILYISAGEVSINRMITGYALDLILFSNQLGNFLPLVIIGPLSEEIGWRGYAQDRLQKTVDSIFSSVILGVLWVLWHLPLFYIVGTGQYELGLPLLPFLFSLAALSIGYGWLHNNTGRSIWAAIFSHWIYDNPEEILLERQDDCPPSGNLLLGG